MRSTLFKKIQHILWPIKVYKQKIVFPDMGRVDLVIIRRNDNGRPSNTVWLMGNILDVAVRLFDLNRPCLEQTKLGKEYGAHLHSTFKIEITQPFPIRKLCRRLKIRRIIIAYRILPVL